MVSGCVYIRTTRDRVTGRFEPRTTGVRYITSKYEVLKYDVMCMYLIRSFDQIEAAIPSGVSWVEVNHTGRLPRRARSYIKIDILYKYA